jgi:hypothetical protein
VPPAQENICDTLRDRARDHRAPEDFVDIRIPTLHAGITASLWLALGGCPPGPSSAPVFPADYRTSYVEVRDCRRSPDHDLSYIRVLASPDAESVYRTRTGAFPEGAVVLKEEYGDPACSDLSGWSAMRREGGAWHWQDVAVDRVVVEDDGPRCVACHASCGVPPDGYEGTCALP